MYKGSLDLPGVSLDQWFGAHSGIIDLDLFGSGYAG
jgi:hypothetical protein